MKRTTWRAAARAAASVSALCCALAMSCATTTRTQFPVAAEGGSPGELRGAEALEAQVLWRQTVTARWSGGTETFDAAVQVRGNEFLVLGLSPIGQPGFVLRLVDGVIDVENNSGREIVVPARSVLLDVQRVFFPWIEGVPPQDGERRADRFGEHVTERFAAGRLVERRFVRLDGAPPGEILVTYEWLAESTATDLAPARARLVNGWYGYEIEVLTHDETRLDEQPAAGH